MGMKLPRRWKLPPIARKKISAEYLALCAFFLFGVLAGHLVAGLVPGSSRGELGDYLLQYAGGTADGLPVGAVLFAYFRAPAVFVVLGLLAWGVWLIPGYMVVQGALLAFSVRCFVSALGRGGLYLALAAFGMRCLFLLPCCFYLAGSVWRTAKHGTAASVRTAGRKDRLFPLLLCALILLIGCVMELSLVPKLYSWVLLRCF